MKAAASVCAAGSAVGLVAALRCWGRRPQAISRPGGWATVDTPPAKGAAEFHSTYHPYSAILSRLEAVAAANPSVATLRFAGPMPILTLRATCWGLAGSMPQAWIEGGIHPCERIGPAVVMRLIDEVLAAPSLLGKAEWHFAPVVETEGYKITWESDRWNKGCPSGVNPNMNFPFHWGELPAAIKILKRIFPELINLGKEPACEPSVQAVIGELRRKDNLKLFLDFHSFGARWLYPWGHTLAPSKDKDVHEAACRTAVDAANAIARSWEYKAIPAAAMEAPAGGTALDFAYGELGCVHSYVVELPPELPKDLAGNLLRGFQAGDLKLFWKEGMALSHEHVTQVGDEMTLAVKALAELALRP